MTDSQLLLVLLADWLEFDVRRAPPLVLLYFNVAPAPLGW